MTTKPTQWIVLILGALCLQLAAQSVSQETRNRITLPTAPENRTPEQWTAWQPAPEDEFPWAPRNFWQGWTKVSMGGKKVGIFAAFFVPSHKLEPGELGKTVPSGFGDAGADYLGSRNLEVSGYTGEEMEFVSPNGNGLFFTDPKAGVPTSANFVYFELEKERDRAAYPFLAFFFATPSIDYSDVKPEFDAFLQQVVIRALPASVSGQVTAHSTGIGLGNVKLQLVNAKMNQAAMKTSAIDGTYKFDSLSPGNYYLSIAEAKGFRIPATPSILELRSAQDTVGVNYDLEPEVIASKPERPTKSEMTKESAGLGHWSLGIGYRHRLNDIWGMGVNLRSGNFVPEFAVGLDVGGEGSDTVESSEGRLFLSLGASYFFLSADNAHLGLGLYGMTQLLGSKMMLGAEVPLTVEYFVIPKLSIQASTGVVLTDLTDNTSISVGPQSILSSLGFTWYLK
jgi:hypothetical protein